MSLATRISPRYGSALTSHCPRGRPRLTDGPRPTMLLVMILALVSPEGDKSKITHAGRKREPDGNESRTETRAGRKRESSNAPIIEPDTRPTRAITIVAG